MTVATYFPGTSASVDQAITPSWPQLMAFCRIDDSTVDYLADPNVQRSAPFRLRAPETTISVPLSSDFVIQLALRGRQIRCRAGAVPSRIKHDEIRTIGDVLRLGGELFPLAPGMTLSSESFQLRVAPEAPPEARAEAEEILRRMRD